MAIKGNKGEWSEFYVFLKLLVDKKLFAADEELKINESIFYTILKIFRQEADNGSFEYSFTNDENVIQLQTKTGTEFIRVDKDQLKIKVAEILAAIQGSKKTFDVPCAQKTLEKFFVKQIKAAHNNKADIVLSVNDAMGGIQAEVGYSIKSMIGGASTLFNSSGASNFIYKISDFVGSDGEVNSIIGKNKIRKRIQVILSNGGRLTFYKMQSQTFEANLRMVDGDLPEIIGEIVKYYYQGQGNLFPQLIEKLKESNFGLSTRTLNQSHYEYKIKSCLLNVALGMVADTEWDGYLKAHGGYIIVKKDGQVGCYQPYNGNKFQEYLFKKTKLDTPSTTKFKFAEIYTENGEKFIKLNLQVRFVK